MNNEYNEYHIVYIFYCLTSKLKLEKYEFFKIYLHNYIKL